MKKILIIEDDQIVANVYRNKFAVEGYQVKLASDGETGLKSMHTFGPDLIVLDLILPDISGVDVIQKIRGETAFSKTPIIVFSNTYLTNLIQEAWRAGANKCLSKSNCTPKEVIEVVRHSIGDSGASHLTNAPIKNESATATTELTTANDAEFQADLRKAFIENLPAILDSLQAGLQALNQSENELTRLKRVHEIYRQIHALNGNAGVAGLVQIARMASAFEALLKQVYEQPKSINASTLRTIAASVDFLSILFDKGTLPEHQEAPTSRILVVNNDAISRRAIAYALEKAQLKSISAENPEQALQLLTENDFDLVFLDVDTPGMTGLEFCAKLRAMPQHKNTPTVFVASLKDFDAYTHSATASGNDLIGKPFLFIELTVKALTHALRAKLQPANDKSIDCL
ncbi:MAG: response regulator [Verrucomicrobiota bacterium]